jgi:hypothetical protein
LGVIEMKEYAVVVTTMEVVYVKAETEDQAMNFVRAKLPPRSTATLQIAKEVVLDERKDS